MQCTLMYIIQCTLMYKGALNSVIYDGTIVSSYITLFTILDYIVHCAVYSVQGCSTPLYSVYNVQYTLYTVQYILGFSHDI